MNETADRTAWIDRAGDTWVRVDEVAGRRGPWRCLCDGPHWEAWAGPGGSRDWADVQEHGPLSQADQQRTAAAVDRILRLEGAR